MLTVGAALYWRPNMKTTSMMAIASAIALSALAFTAMPKSAEAGPIVPPGRYCLLYDLGGTDCSFTSYAQCLATASGLGAECYGKTVRDDEESQIQGPRAGEYRGPVYCQACSGFKGRTVAVSAVGPPLAEPRQLFHSVFPVGTNNLHPATRPGENRQP